MSENLIKSKDNKTFRVYVIEDSYLEDCFLNDDLEAFAEVINDEDDFVRYDYEDFTNEKDAMKFVEGLFFGCDERSPCGKVVLCSWNEYDEPFINALLNV